LIEKTTPGTNQKLLIGGAVGLVILLVLIFGVSKLFSHSASTSTVSPTSTTEKVIVPVTEALATNTSVTFAPMCQPPKEVQPPLLSLIKETSRTCNSGVPYTTIAIPKGATFTPVDDAEFKCTPVGTRGNSDLITCTGKPLFAFDLKVCMPVPLPTLITDTNKCPSGTGFDEGHQCCAQLPPADAGCVIFKAGTTGCN
jgi:hypothetical protein